jgi:hypothetical protein
MYLCFVAAALSDSFPISFFISAICNPILDFWSGLTLGSFLISSPNANVEMGTSSDLIFSCKAWGKNKSLELVLSLVSDEHCSGYTQFLTIKTLPLPSLGTRMVNLHLQIRIVLNCPILWQGKTPPPKLKDIGLHKRLMRQHINLNDFCASFFLISY